MYNGIGLETARGSGTNGYVQRNLSFIRRHKDNVDYKSEDELRKMDSQLNRGPSQEILDHERKRKVELKCMEMQELMEEQGYNEEEIEHKVSIYRQMLMEKVNSSQDSAVDKDDTGRPVAKQTHQIAEANQARNQQLKSAFGLSDFYQDGSSMDPQRKTKEQAAEALAVAQKKYTMVAKSNSSSSPSPDLDRVRHKKQSLVSGSDHTGKDKSARLSSPAVRTKSQKYKRVQESADDSSTSKEWRANDDAEHKHRKSRIQRTCRRDDACTSDQKSSTKHKQHQQHGDLCTDQSSQSSHQDTYTSPPSKHTKAPRSSSYHGDKKRRRQRSDSDRAEEQKCHNTGRHLTSATKMQKSSNKRRRFHNEADRLDVDIN